MKNASFGKTRLREDATHDVGFFDAAEVHIQAAEGVGEARVVDAQDVEHRGAGGREGGPDLLTILANVVYLVLNSDVTAMASIV
jgi:hypothetical protein